MRPFTLFVNRSDLSFVLLHSQRASSPFVVQYYAIVRPGALYNKPLYDHLLRFVNSSLLGLTVVVALLYGFVRQCFRLAVVCRRK